MTRLITDLLDPVDLLDETVEGYVRRRLHPEDERLAILNYSEKAQYEGRWNRVTRQCRGLIYNQETGRVLARPYDKFFNVGQPEAAQIDPFAIVEVTDKMDGSLGIIYPHPRGTWAVATHDRDGTLSEAMRLVTADDLDGANDLLRPMSVHLRRADK